MSLHNTTSHRDQESLKQTMGGNTASANFANIYRRHQSESPVNGGDCIGGLARTAVERAPRRDQQRHTKMNRAGRKRLAFRSFGGGGGESTVLVAIAGKYEGNDVFGKNDCYIKLLVDSGACEHYLDDRPGLRERVCGCTRLEEPRETTTTGNHRLKRVATEIFSGYIIDQTGGRHQARLPVALAPGLQRLGSDGNGAGSYSYHSYFRPGGVADRDQQFHDPHRSTARPGDSRDSDKNPWITASGCTGRRRITGSTGGRCRRTTITDG